MRSPRVLLMTAACALAGMLAAGCANPPPTFPNFNSNYVVEFSCCFTAPNATVWQPGQQVPLDWTPEGGQANGHKLVAQVTLTAVLTGPYPTIADLNDANNGGPDQSRIAATAPVIKLSVVPTIAPVSVLTIPRSTAPGLYNLWTTAAAQGMSNGQGWNITVG